MTPRIVVLVLDPIPLSQLGELGKRAAAMLNREPDEIVLSPALAKAHNARFAFGVADSLPKESE